MTIDYKTLDYYILRYNLCLHATKRNFSAIGDWKRYIKEEHKNVFYEVDQFNALGKTNVILS